MGHSQSGRGACRPAEAISKNRPTGSGLLLAALFGFVLAFLAFLFFGNFTQLVGQRGFSLGCGGGARTLVGLDMNRVCNRHVVVFAGARRAPEW